jgi:hypothetical protein
VFSTVTVITTCPVCKESVVGKKGFREGTIPGELNHAEHSHHIRRSYTHHAAHVPGDHDDCAALVVHQQAAPIVAHARPVAAHTELHHSAVMAVNTSSCLLVRTMVSVLFMFDRKPQSMNRGELRSFSQSTVMYTVAAANRAQHNAGTPCGP